MGKKGQATTEYSLLMIVVLIMVGIAANCSRVDDNGVHHMKCSGKLCDKLEDNGYKRSR